MRRKPQGLLTLGDFSASDVSSIIRAAMRLKGSKRSTSRKLASKTLAMIFAKPSTRTRVSFEVAMSQLGGHAVVLDGASMQMSRGETLADTARTLSRYVDTIMARVYDHADIEELARHASVPVINGLSNSFHPCQTLADLVTIREHKGRLRGLDVAWVGDGNNVCNSLIYGCALTGMNIKIASPGGFAPDARVIRESKKRTHVSVMADPASAVRGADVVATDTFSSIHNTASSRRKKFLPKYRVTNSLMAKADSDAIFMHCLPAKRGEEVSASVIDGPQSVVWDEAENRLHAQKALLSYLM